MLCSKKSKFHINFNTKIQIRTTQPSIHKLTLPSLVIMVCCFEQNFFHENLVKYINYQLMHKSNTLQTRISIKKTTQRNSPKKHYIMDFLLRELVYMYMYFKYTPTVFQTIS